MEIGTGSGYQADILAEIVDSVYTIEIVAELGRDAKKCLGALGLSLLSEKQKKIDQVLYLCPDSINIP